MKPTTDQIGLLKRRLLDQTRTARRAAAIEISEQAGDDWAQELLCLGLFDACPDLAEICADSLARIVPNKKTVFAVLSEIEGGDRVTGDLAEKIATRWGAANPRFIRVLAMRGFNIRTQRILLELLRSNQVSPKAAMTAVFTEIASLVPQALLNTIYGRGNRFPVYCFQSSANLVQMMALLFPLIRSNRKVLEVYLKTLTVGPIHWLSEQLLDPLLGQIKPISRTEPLADRLLTSAAERAIDCGNGGMLLSLLPILTHSADYSRQNALLLARIAAGESEHNQQLVDAAKLAARRIGLFAAAVLDSYRPLLVSDPSNSSAVDIIKTAVRVGYLARPLLPQIAVFLRQASTDEERLIAINAMGSIGFTADSEAAAALTLQSMSGSEEVKEAAIKALKRHQVQIKPQTAAPVLKPAALKPPHFPLSLSELPEAVAGVFSRLLTRRVAAPYLVPKGRIGLL